VKKSIFQPLQIGPIRVKNRIEVAPAAPFLANHDSSVSRELFEYTMSLARSGAGIVTIGVSSVDPQPSFGARTLCVHSPLVVSGLSDLAEGIHRYGAMASIELVHSKYMLSDPMKVVNETTTEDVEEIIRLFAEGAETSRKAGFNMVMIHGGHGNVPAMFLYE
jgi:2,4-dienoyl-CoA reductase-like NADH-dependent reductase (Old Yellow Enzyme family)